MARTRRTSPATTIRGLAGLAPLCLLVLLASCGGEEEAGGRAPAAEASGFSAASAIVDNPLFPLSSVRTTVFEWTERDSETGETIELRVDSRVLDETKRVAGVEVAVVDVNEFENGELVEHTLDYYAQDVEGNVWYFGEHVDDYEDGKIVGHSGQWLAGEGDAKAGLFMPANPKVGDKFEQERAPGVAEDRSKVVAAGVRVKTPAGSFSDCVKTEDFAPLDNVTEFKFYCRGVGVVRELPAAGGGRLDLVQYG
jgi:hypothetical protein